MMDDYSALSLLVLTLVCSDRKLETPLLPVSICQGAIVLMTKIAAYKTFSHPQNMSVFLELDSHQTNHSLTTFFHDFIGLS